MMPLVALSTRRSDEKTSLGTLSIHLDGAPCRVGCAFCYLGARRDGEGAPPAGSGAAGVGVTVASGAG